MAMAETTTYEKITVNLIEKASKALAASAAREGGTRTDTVNRALQVCDYLSAELAKGNDLLIRQADDSLIKLKLI